MKKKLSLAPLPLVLAAHLATGCQMGHVEPHQERHIIVDTVLSNSRGQPVLRGNTVTEPCMPAHRRLEY